MESFSFKQSPCPNCRRSIDTCHSASGERGPQSGDLSICLYCGHLSAYGDDMALRELTDAEVVEVAGDPELIQASNVAAFIRKRLDGVRVAK
jgi:hypothetical protein